MFKWLFGNNTSAPDKFEKEFIKRIGQHPVDFILTKLSVGSDVKAVRYLYDITAAEIERGILFSWGHSFDRYYPDAAEKLKKHKAYLEEHREDIFRESRVSRQIEVCQREFLNIKGNKPFYGQCEKDLEILYHDDWICKLIGQIAKENHRIELCDIRTEPEFVRFKRDILPKRMEELGITRHSAVRSICTHVVEHGSSRKSALITIYYAVRSHIIQTADLTE